MASLAVNSGLHVDTLNKWEIRSVLHNCSLLGQLVFFRESQCSDNPGDKNTNLLGADFLNQFI